MIETAVAAVILMCLGSVLLFCELLPALAKPDPSSEPKTA